MELLSPHLEITLKKMESEGHEIASHVIQIKPIKPSDRDVLGIAEILIHNKIKGLPEGNDAAHHISENAIQLSTSGKTALNKQILSLYEELKKKQFPEHILPEEHKNH